MAFAGRARRDTAGGKLAAGIRLDLPAAGTAVGVKGDGKNNLPPLGVEGGVLRKLVLAGINLLLD